MKVDLADIEHILNSHQLEQKLVEQIVQEAKQAAEDAKNDGLAGGVAGKKAKYKHLIVVSDPDGKYPDIANVPMWVFKVKEDEKHTEVLPRFYKGVYEANAKGRKFKKNPLKTVGDAIQNVPTKYFKPEKSPVLTKNPVIVLVTNNQIPK